MIKPELDTAVWSDAISLRNLYSTSESLADTGDSHSISHSWYTYSRDSRIF